MNEKYESKGLTIVGLTSEGESKTEPWIKKHDATFAYAYDRGGKMKGALKINSIPRSIIVGATGEIIWEGYPSDIPEDLLASALKDTISVPVYEWTGPAKDIKKAFLKGDYGKALKAADKLAAEDDLGKEIGAMVRRIIATRIDTIEGKLEKGEVLEAYQSAKAFAKNIKGLPEAEGIKAISKRISSDKGLKKILSTQERLADIVAAEHKKRKDCEKSIAKLEKLLKSNKDEYTEEKIRKSIKSLKETRRKLRS